MKSKIGATMNFFSNIENRLASVTKPARYIGNELNSIAKNPAGKLNITLAFPDLYEIGMSFTGLQILYHLINKEKDLFCERVFSPWEDMEKLLRDSKTTLFSLETKTPLDKMDVIGFSFQYELSFTNVLNILDLGNIPIKSKDRLNSELPLIFAGGPCVFNPEPMSRFIDVFYIGEAETELIYIFNYIKKEKDNGKSRKEILEVLNKEFNCLYIPILEKEEIIGNFTVPVLNKEIIRTFPDNFKPEDFPETLILPNTSVVYDRITLEISRGCDEGCRFCQAGMIYRPAREREPLDLINSAENLTENTGHGEISLSSLSAADYPAIENLVETMIDRFIDDRVSIALPSIRADRFKEDFAQQIKRIRKTGFTIAPEAGSQKLRNIINKNLCEEDILSAAKTAYDNGWDHIKLYFMIGLPFEEDSDIEEMVALTEKIAKMKRKGYVVLSVSSFVPKPHTPFQWAEQITTKEISRKQQLIKSLIRLRNVKFRYHDADQSFIEGLMARGDRTAGSLIEYIFNNKGRFDSWGECFSMELWEKAIKETNFNSDFIHQEFNPETIFPWDFINTSVAKEYTLKEWDKAIKGEATVYCDTIEKCNNCKACSPTILKSRFKNKENMKKVLKEEVSKSRLFEPNENSNRFTYLFSYSKLGLIKLISHLDLKTVLIRGLRIAKLSISYTKGFNPRPIISFAPALELGIEGENEYFIAEFSEKLNIEETILKLNNNLPDGVKIKSCKPIAFEKRNFLSQTAITDYLVTFDKQTELTAWKDKTYTKKSKKGYKTLLIADFIKNIKEIDNCNYLISTFHSQQKGSIKITEITKEIFQYSEDNSVKIIRKTINYV